MIGASSLSGDTLIACHFPVVQLPTWQLPVQDLCSSAKRSGRLCAVGLTRAVSLPEQDSLNREQGFVGGRRPFSSSYSRLNEDRAEEEGGASDSSGRYDSTSSPEETSSYLKKESSETRGSVSLSPEETSSYLKKESSEVRGSVRSHNSFLPCTQLDEDEEDEDSDGDNLHRYHEDSSFLLHGNSNWPLSNGARHYAVPLGDMEGEWGKEGTVLGIESNQEWLSNQPNPLDSHVNRSGVTRMACGEQDSDRHKCSPEVMCNTEYVSDSSCNSSDGVLVNFCTMYNRSNNPATPRDLSSPALPPSQSHEGSVFLNLHPVPQTRTEDLQQADMRSNSPPKDEVDLTPSASRWSPQGLDSNCNLFSLEPLPPGLSSLEVSDLTACLQSQSTLAIGTNQKYYKLVTCDLSSQSPSPAWSSVNSCPEGPSRSSPLPPSEHLFIHYVKEGPHTEEKKDKVDQQKENMFSSHFQTDDYQAASTSTDKGFCRRKHTDSIQDLCRTPCSLCPSPCSPRSRKGENTSGASIQPSGILNREHCYTDAAEEGACSLENALVRYSKAQRPTSLPIQPFVLSPADKQQTQAQHLGCLLEQYINQKSSRSSSSEPGRKGKGKSSRCFSNLQPSPASSRRPIFLEAPSSSDTCSTCTPSPECFGRRHTWSQASRSQGRVSPCTSKSSLGPSHTSPKPRSSQELDKTSPCSGTTQTNSCLNLTSAPNQSSRVKIPTCEDLIELTPEQSYVDHQPQNNTSYHSIFSHTPPILALTTDTRHPNLQVSSSTPTFSQTEKKLPHRRATPSADSGFFHGSFTAALSSVTPLSSLSSLLSSAASGLHPQQMQDSAGHSGRQSQSQHSESLILSDRPPTEFCLSPETSYESLSISHLQRRGLLRSVSRAVDLIMAHFGSSRDPEEKMRLGNSSWSPTIAGLVLEHLCPTIQNILEDGLRDHKLDLIIGQRRNHSWTLVDISTRIGPSTRVLHSLVSKIKQCPQLSSHCMRMRAFIMGLLNLRALEFWLSHFQSQKNLITTNYHSWGFLSMSLGQCQPLFQELLLLLQPLSVLPFDLNLLLEPRLLCNRQLCPEEQGVSPPQPCSALLATNWPLLQADRKVDSSYISQQTKMSQHIGVHHQESPSRLNSSSIKLQCGGTQANRSPWLAPIPEWCQKEPDLVDGVVEGEDCSQNYADTWSQISMDSKQEEKRRDKDNGTLNASACVQVESPCQGGLRWAKLFGAADSSSRAETVSQSPIGAQTRRRPSQWLHLDRSQLGLLAQSIKSMKIVAAQINKTKDY
ncbi:AP-4 complex accessory subunit RUSC2 isoform X1 [Hippoglossus stenolepis]|uniref:AP-4 complex accessory subunit RUSC2 isoform X1 n=1 Tax=Hippoglossus stenolepis TaxID=195615 RepID=UPI001FAF49E8|nr:AP-4 complex accessory subunit RUSC2 isoform X1 [Hippoglossus stenolepis]XP_035039733.2 AP-4 complex accessory subunit RUSC2 isoform X1 [Hippoglossus stenolepis]XP_035039735.2 AP-4 complex accessory subunit RUSC2 isoform X1 [Hippoglossus stenolepis]